jgi:hypothetical protein
MFTVSDRAFVRSFVVVDGYYYYPTVSLDSNPAYYHLQRTNMIRVRESAVAVHEILYIPAAKSRCAHHIISIPTIIQYRRPVVVTSRHITSQRRMIYVIGWFVINARILRADRIQLPLRRIFGVKRATTPIFLSRALSSCVRSLAPCPSLRHEEKKNKKSF